MVVCLKLAFVADCAPVQVPHIVNGSMMLGAIIMFGIVLPIAKSHAGVWYPPHSELSSSKDVRGPYVSPQTAACSQAVKCLQTDGLAPHLQHALQFEEHSHGIQELGRAQPLALLAM